MPTSSPSLRLQHLSFSFEDRTLFDDVTLHLGSGWTGVVGPNGAGKSTLLELLAGLRAPTSGQLQRDPVDARVTLCPQRVEACEPAVQAFAEDPGRDAHRWRASLALDAATLARWPTLSPGERKRWQLGAALASEPEVLLLDEPLNHLDADAQRLLVGALKRYRGVGVLVAHDRAFLDLVTDATLRLVDGEVQLWPGAFTVAREAWQRDEEAARHAHAATKRQLDGQLKHLDAERRRMEGASRARSTGARMKHANDSDARSLGANFRAEMAEKATARDLRRSKQATARLEERLASLEVRHEEVRALFVKDERCPRPVVASYSGALRAGDQVLASDVSAQVLRGAHVVLSGPNGAGKTTLLNALLAACTLPPERVLVLPQELTQEEQQADLELLHGLERAEKGQVLQLVDALGLDPEQLLRTDSPSPGEGRKLRLALGLGRSAWLAVLDEPTNHLDLPSVERLEGALQAFPGALVVVSHDARLREALGQTRWQLEQGVLRTA
jgi:ATPase subunit of ABC transporter with duplicated ATPase domains